MRVKGNTAINRRLASRFMGRCLCIGSVLLVIFDWSFDLLLVPLPFSKYIRVLLLSTFLVYIFRTGIDFGRFRFPFGNVLLFYGAVNIIYSVLSVHIVDSLYYSSRIIFWVFGAVVAYRLTLVGSLSPRMLQRTIVATVFVGSAFTIYFMTRPGVEAGQNASAYLLLWCLPFILMHKRSSLDNFVLIMAVLAILLTVKRGAMIGLCTSFIAYGLVYLKLFGNAKQFLRLIRALVVLGIIAFYALSANWDDIQTRFQDISGSGRDRVYAMLFDHWANSEPANIVFGFGIQSVQRYTGYMYHGRADASGVYAHSDWLQLMHDFGLVGITFLVWLHINFIYFILISYKKKHTYTPSLVMGYVILFLVNIYSGHLMSPNALYFGILLAFCSAQIMPHIPPVPRKKATVRKIVNSYRSTS